MALRPPRSPSSNFDVSSSPPPLSSSQRFFSHPPSSEIIFAASQSSYSTEKRNKMWEEDRRKAAFGRITWEEMLTHPKFATKAAQSMKSLGLIDQFSSPLHLTNSPHASGSEHYRLDTAGKGRWGPTMYNIREINL